MFFMSISSCKKIPNPYSNSDEKDTITYDLLKTSIVVQFFDANTNEYIIPEEGVDFKVRIVGKSKDVIADIVGLQQDEYTPRKGIITFGLVPGAESVPSTTSPIRFTIIAQLYNYLVSTKEVVITGEGDYLVKIFMVNCDNPPQGVSIKKIFSVGNLVNGVLQDDVSIVTENSEATVIIPAGIKLLRKDSVELAGKLNITLVYYSILEDNALTSYTGGITGTVMENNSLNSGMFFPAGLLTFEISDSDWHKASIIENDSIEILLEILNEAYNPVSGSNIVSGDSVSLYSYMPDTGLWVFDQSVYITDTLLGVLSASVKTLGLHSYNFSWFAENNCNQRSSFEIGGSCMQCSSVMIEGVVRKQADNSFVSNISCIGKREDPLNIPFSTGVTPVYIEWGMGDECNFCYVDPAVSPLMIDNMCSQPTIELPLADVGPVSMSITAHFIGSCVSDTNIVVLPSFGVWVRPIDASCWRWSSMKNGVSKICNVIYGETYVIGTYYNGIWKEWEVTITEESSYVFDMEFSQSICSWVFGIL